ncbi:alpha/beta fold hydrolase [Spirillospora sp. CA-255316]
MRQMAVNGLVFDCEEGGAGQPVVLLHGFPESAASWRAVASMLHEAGFATLAPNQRGYSPGARPQGVEHYAVELLVGDVLALAGEWGAPRFHLVGHDWGAIVAWHVAALHPDRVATLTAVSVPHPAAWAWAIEEDEDQRNRSAYIDVLRTPGTGEEVMLARIRGPQRTIYGGLEDSDLRAEHTAVMTRPGTLTAALNWYRAMQLSSFLSLPAVTVPTTYVWGDQDPPLGRAGALRCAEHVETVYEFVELRGANHWIPENEPADVAAAIVGRAQSLSLPALR